MSLFSLHWMLRRIQYQDLYMHLESHPNIKENLARLTDMCSMFVDAKVTELQMVLEELDPVARTKRVLTLMRKDLEKFKLQQELMKESYESLNKMHRKYGYWNCCSDLVHFSLLIVAWDYLVVRVLLQEQRDLINKELGTDKDSAKAKMKQKFLDNLKGKTLPEEVQRVVNEEMERFSGMVRRSAMSADTLRESVCNFLWILSFASLIGFIGQPLDGVRMGAKLPELGHAGAMGCIHPG